MKDTDMPCPHCMVKAIAEHLLDIEMPPEEIVEYVLAGLKEGLADVQGLTIMSSIDSPLDVDAIH